VPDTAAGTEVYYSLVGGTSKTLAENILDNIIKLGKVNRGTKTWKGANGLDYLGFIRMTTCPAVLVETCFINNVADQKCIETTEGQKAMGVAIAKGVLATLGIKYQEKTTSGTKPIENVSNKPESGAKTLYRVQVGAFAERKNAENMLNKLVAAGFKGFIIKIN
jgi:N-acetylmuramoyl-L-alanine amidase